MPQDEKLSRRRFMRLFALATAGAAVSACDGAVPTGLGSAATTGAAAATTPTVQPSSTPVPPIELSLRGTDADVWTWIKPVQGKAGGSEGCEKLVIDHNGLPVEIEHQGETIISQIAMQEGENRIAIVCRTPEGREERSNMLRYQERLRSAPTARIKIVNAKDQIVLDGSESQSSEGDPASIVERIWSARAGNPAPLMAQGIAGLDDRELDGEISGETLTILPPTVDGEYYVNLRVVDERDREDRSTIYFTVENGSARIPDYDREAPAWVENCVVYGVIPRLFGVPAFRAIAERLDDLAELGVGALWLAPVFVSPEGDYGYAIKDYFELNPDYGTKEDFHRMVQEAHARGIRVLMDFVPNHSSEQHPYFVDAEKNGENSSYWEFYDRDVNGKYTYYFDWTYLPNLNYHNPEVLRWMQEAFSYWVREFDVDGFRVDVAWGIRDRNPDFWPAWRKELKRIKPDLLLLAEASARDPYYFDNGFDVAYDWTDQLGRWAWTEVWNTYKHRLLSYYLDHALTYPPKGYHPDAYIFRFLNNNDTAERFITRHGAGFAQVATALLLTLPGLPCVYTGDEVGAEFHPYQDAAPLAWEERVPGIRDYHKRLISLRKELPSLHSRKWERVKIERIPQEVYAYIRYGEEGDAPVLVLLNFFEETAEVAFTLPEQFASLLEEGELVDLLSGEKVAVNRSNPVVPVPGLTARILTQQA